jgi:CopG antitoxin of type II toxin-antitoxin system
LSIIFPFDENPNVNQLASAAQVGAGERLWQNKAKSVPRLKSIDELVEFFDKHDMGDCWDRLPKAEVEVKIKTRKHLVVIDEKIIPSINQIAKAKRVTSAKLINRWLREKIATSKRA